MTTLIVACAIWQWVLWTPEGRPVYGPVIWDQAACDADAAVAARQLEIPAQPCNRIQLCFPQASPMPSLRVPDD